MSSPPDLSCGDGEGSGHFSFGGTTDDPTTSFREGTEWVRDDAHMEGNGVTAYGQYVFDWSQETDPTNPQPQPCVNGSEKGSTMDYLGIPFVVECWSGGMQAETCDPVAVDEDVSLTLSFEGIDDLGVLQVTASFNGSGAGDCVYRNQVVDTTP